MGDRTVGKVKLPFWRVRWDGTGENAGKKIVSAVGYSMEGADARAKILVTQGYKGVEVFESKPGSDEEL